MGSQHRVILPQYARGRNGIEIEPGSTLWDHVWKMGVQIASACGQRGQCGKCVVRVEKGMGSLAPRTSAERAFTLDHDERLACQARVTSAEQDIILYIEAAGEYAILTENVEASVPLDPAVYREGERVIWDGAHTYPLGPYEGQILGLAIDVGTTTLVAQVLDLEGGEVVDTLACKNPQAAYGDDVISRIAYADEHADGLARLQGDVTAAINAMLRDTEARGKSGLRDHIYEAVIVGNPTMRNLFFGQSVHSLGTSPYEPDDTAPINARARDLGLQIHAAANAYGAPLVAGQVGADTIGMILACDMYKRRQPSMAVDIGTNGEVALGNKDRILAASNAAGGAFEGATVSCGTGAIRGAIQNVHIADGQVRYETIGGAPPVGICGSGLIDLLAGMLRAGIIDSSGRFSASHQARNEFVVTMDGKTIGITQKDINELRLAKAGSALNQQTLMNKYGVDLDGLDRIYLAGGFGNYVDLDSAVAIGILPDTRSKLAKIGNGALSGARQMLLCRQRRADAERVARRIEHVRLSEEKDFLERYVEQLYLRRWP